MTADVRTVRRRLDAIVPPPAAEALLDIEGRLSRLHDDLRDLAQALEIKSLTELSLRETLQREMDGFRKRSPIRLELDLSGDLDDLTPSQRIVVARVVQEALSNVCEHSGARHASVAVAGREDVLAITVRDDGEGFDTRAVEHDLREHVRLGIIGMAERVRLLEGTFSLVTQPGGPTTISASIPRWRPAGDAR